MRVIPTPGLERSQQTRSREEGFSLIQAIIVLAVAAILTAAAAISIQGSRHGVRLSNSARKLASYLEAARADSVRRRAQTGNESSVQIIDNNTYRVTMGFGGSNVLTSRDFDLEDSVVFETNPMTLTFNWRGRPLNGTESTYALKNSSGFTQVDVTGSGDVTVGSEVFQDDSIPPVTLNTNVSDDVMPDQPNPDASPTPTPSPSPSATPTPTPTATPTPTPTATPTPTPTPSPTPVICTPSVSPPLISIRKNGGSDTVTVLVAGGSGTVSASGPSNLTITPESATVASGGSAVFTITSNNSTRGEFTVTLSTPCGSTHVVVSVTN